MIKTFDKIADLKFNELYTLVVIERTPDLKDIFSMDVSTSFPMLYTLQKEGKFLQTLDTIERRLAYFLTLEEQMKYFIRRFDWSKITNIESYFENIFENFIRLGLETLDISLRFTEAKINNLSDLEKIDAGMMRAKKYAISQYQSVKNYMESLGVDKPIHIGETGWASFSTGYYGPKGSKACDEYKEALYYKHMRDWTNEVGMSCFYFEGFDEPWKGGSNPQEPEKNWGLYYVDRTIKNKE